MTATEFCEAHQVDDLDATPIAPYRPPFDPEAFLERTRAEWTAKARERAAAQRDEQRDELEGLRRVAERADRAGEQPRFTHG